jgi:glycosyltransferase involved in cell wall biosynthesis
MAAYRVLVATNLWPTESDPGWGSFVRAQMESLRPLGVDFDLLFINGRESRWNYWRAIGELRRRLKRQRYDLIHAHFGLSGLVARCQIKVPVVISFMGDDVLGQPRLDGRITRTGRFYQISSFVLARLAAAVIVKSREMKSSLRLDRAHVIPNGVDLDLFSPGDQVQARQALGLDPAKKFILFPYDPAEARKRYDLIEAAAALARAEVPEIEILRVRGAPRHLMPLYMNAADMLVLASSLEGSPNAVKEAMAVNLPVVAVDVGDVAELLGSAQGNYLVPRSAEAMASRIVEVCRKGTRSRGRAGIARLSMPNVARQIVEVYAELRQGSEDRRQKTGDRIRSSRWRLSARSRQPKDRLGLFAES